MIFVSIASFRDKELIKTVNSCLSKAKYPENIKIGICWQYDEEEDITALDNIEQVESYKVHWKDVEGSVCWARSIIQKKLFKDEEYYFQIDSHTLFEKNWDTRLISMYKGALEATQNPKTIMTAYLPGFKHLDSGERVPVRHDKIAQYPIMLFRTWVNTGIPAWKDEPLAGPDSHQYKSDELYVPAVKFNAQFVFSNKHYFGNTGLDIDTIFWEEEIIQTMSLLESGFSLVFPNMTVPLSHLFQNNTSFEEVLHPTYRVSGANPNMLPNVEYYNNIRDNWVKYVTNPDNKSKVDLFCKYTKINLKYGPFKEGYIPKEFNR